MATHGDERTLAPYELADLSGARALVLAPHPDDEVFGCGGAIAAHVKAGDPVRVVVLSDGAKGDSVSNPDLVDTRHRETLKAAKVLGVRDIFFLDFPDRHLQFQSDLPKRIIEHFSEFRPEIVYVPSPVELHPDHRATADLLWACAHTLQSETRIAFYEVSQSMAVNTLVGIDEFHETKKEASAAFQSQLDTIPYLDLINGLNRYRSYTVSSECRYAEGFFVTDAGTIRESTPADFFFWQKSPMETPERSRSPRVSILVRTRNRHRLLRQALESVASQTESSLEVVIVNDGGSCIAKVIEEFKGRLMIRVLEHKDRKGAAASANTALRAARGEYVNFLDDDDLLYPDHVKMLADKLDYIDNQVAHADSEKVFCHEDGSESLVYRFNNSFSLAELKVKNRVPVQAVMFQRDLVEKVGEQDESLEVMEDWDYWIRMYKQAPFYRIEKLTSKVRSFKNPPHDFDQWERIIHERHTTPEERLDLLAASNRCNEKQIVALYSRLSQIKKQGAMQDRKIEDLQAKAKTLDLSFVRRIIKKISRVLKTG